ncbi:Uncharacterised protein [Bordetella pertussis]|nr:Uncharacterised protein [Bordetella pertussis]
MLLAAGPALAPLFAILHGAGNGILTIALAPFLFGLALDAWRANALWLSGGIGLAACAALLVLRARPDPIKP